MGPARWTHAVSFKEKTADGKPCATTLTLATDLAPSSPTEAANATAAAGHAGSRFGGGGGRGGEGAPHLSPGLMKSALQKSVRRGRCGAAARAAALLLAENPAEVCGGEGTIPQPYELL